MSAPTIGVFDSGFGGLTVLRSLLARMPSATVADRPEAMSTSTSTGRPARPSRAMEWTAAITPPPRSARRAVHHCAAPTR